MGEKAGLVDEIHKPARKKFPRRYVIIKGLNDLYQADIVEMIPYSDENDGYKYILMIINTFSKMGWALPLKTKSAMDVEHALRKYLASLKRAPKLIQSDAGKEFFNVKVKNLFDEYNIKHYSSFSVLKSSIVERLNRSIKEELWKQFSLQGNYRWVDMIDGVMQRYNNRVHRATGLPPSKINETNEKLVLAKLMNKKLPPKKKNKFKVGDPVRISKYKHVFEKGYTPNWTTEVFTIDSVQKTVPVTYKLKDYENNVIQGGFYEQELSKTEYKDTYLVEKIIKKRGKKVFVKWLGFSDKHNQWIPEEDVLD